MALALPTSSGQRIQFFRQPRDRFVVLQSQCGRDGSIIDLERELTGAGFREAGQLSMRRRERT